MTKEDLIKKISELGFSRRNAATAVENILTRIRESLKKGEQVKVTDFGTFLIKKRAARQGRNPRTGASVKVPEKLVPHFKASKSLKEAVKAGVAGKP